MARSWTSAPASSPVAWPRGTHVCPSALPSIVTGGRLSQNHNLSCSSVQGWRSSKVTVTGSVFAQETIQRLAGSSYGAYHSALVFLAMIESRRSVRCPIRQGTASASAGASGMASGGNE